MRKIIIKYLATRAFNNLIKFWDMADLNTQERNEIVTVLDILRKYL